MKKYCQIKYIIAFSLLLFSASAFSQGLTVPGGIGAWGNMVYFGGAMKGPTTPEHKDLTQMKTFADFEQTADLVLVSGVGFGNPMRNIGVELNLNMLDVSQADLYNVGMKLHRHISNGIFVAVGGENMGIFDLYGNRGDMFPRKNQDRDLTNTGWNGYLAFTHDLSYSFAETNPMSRFSYTLGAGVGRFAYKGLNQTDINPTPDGTFAFGAMQVRLTNYSSFHVEWTGLNLNTGVTLNWKILKIPFSAMIGVADVTPYSGHGPQLLLAGGTAYKFGKEDEKRNRSVKDIIEKNELLASAENKEKERDAILTSANKRFEDKIALLEEEIEQLKTDKEKLETDLQNAQSGSNNSANYNAGGNTNNGNNNANNGGNNNYSENDNVIHSSEEDTHGFNVEPGSYVVVHSFVKRENAERTVAKYKELNIESGIVYNRDEEMHYVYTNAFPVNQEKDAWEKSREQRTKGFNGAWVYTLKGRAADVYVSDRNKVEEFRDYSGDRIVIVSANEDNKNPIEEGAYVVLAEITRLDEALSKSEELNTSGIVNTVIYNHNKEAHYLYSDKYDVSDTQSAVNTQKAIKGDFPSSWVMKFSKSTVSMYGDANVADFGTDQIFTIDPVNDSEVVMQQGYYVVVSSFIELKNAKTSVNTLKTRGLNTKIAFNKDRNRYYVYTDRFESPDRAKVNLNSILSRFKDAWIFKF